MRALELKRLGWKPRDIAAAFGVAEGAVSQWLAAARRGGPDAIASHLSRCGMTPQLTPEQLRLIPDFLWHGAEAYGLRGDVWTCEFLVHLGHLVGDRLLIIWDGSPIHRRAEVQSFVAETYGKVQVERLPAYAPDLNPVEWLWKHLKKVELRILTCLDLEHLHMELHLALGRVRQRLDFVRSFFEGAELEL